MNKINNVILAIILTSLLPLNVHSQKVAQGGFKGLQHIEPTNWWTGMKNPELQLMLHGTDIASSELSIDYPGVLVTQIKRTDNPNYLFVYLNITPETRPGIFKIILKKGRKKQVVNYELKERTPNSANRESFS